MKTVVISNLYEAQPEHFHNIVSYHCATAFSMQSCAESAYQPYADEYH